MQRGFNFVFLRGRSRFAESEFDDVATSLIPILNLLIYFFSGHVSNFEKRENISAIIGALISVPATLMIRGSFFSQSGGRARGSRLIKRPKIIPIEEAISDDAK